MCIFYLKKKRRKKVEFPDVDHDKNYEKLLGNVSFGLNLMFVLRKTLLLIFCFHFIEMVNFEVNGNGDCLGWVEILLIS